MGLGCQRISRTRQPILLPPPKRLHGWGWEFPCWNKQPDPFTTTKKTSRVGLGIPLLEQAAQESGGNLSITSEPGKGTTVRATFQQSHIDRKPLGAMSQTLLTLIAGNPTIDFTYRHTRNNQTVHFDTAAWKQELEGIPINNPEVLRLIKKNLLETLSTIGVS